MISIYSEFLDKSRKTGQEWTERDGQRHMTVELSDWLEGSSSGQIAIQAPTGIGKSCAALLAGVEATKREFGRTVIGTATLVLSDQYSSDIDDVQVAFPDVKFFILKGASNYLCMNNADAALGVAGVGKKKYMQQDLDEFLAGRTDTIPVWAQAETEACSECRGSGVSASAKKRPASKCQYAQARMEAGKADVVITNHKLIECDLKLRAASQGTRSVLGNVSNIIFDEAHKLSSLLYSTTISEKNIRLLDESRVWSMSVSQPRRREIFEHFDNLRMMRERDKEKGIAKNNAEVDWYNPKVSTAKTVSNVFFTMSELMGMKTALGGVTDERLRVDAEKIIDGFTRARNVLNQIVQTERTDGAYAFYLTTSAFEGYKYHLQGMKADLWFQKELENFRVAYISATLGTSERPTHALDSIGLQGVRLVNIESPFEFDRQMQWSWVNDTQVPTNKLIYTMMAKTSKIGGGMLVLVPSHAEKNKLTTSLSGVGAEVRQQADMSLSGSSRIDKRTIAEHKKSAAGGGSPILIGVDTFSTGLNLRGRELNKLLIRDVKNTRVPVAYKNWKYRYLEGIGKSSVEDYELPERAIVLEQQIGRLIRTESDKGIVVFSFNHAAEDGLKRRIVLEAMSRFVGARGVAIGSIGEGW